MMDYLSAGIPQATNNTIWGSRMPDNATNDGLFIGGYPPGHQ